MIKTLPHVFVFSLTGMFLYGLDAFSGGPISKNQAAMDVKHYFLDLRVDPHKKSISGTSTIQFILKEDTPILEIDLSIAKAISE